MKRELLTAALACALATSGCFWKRKAQPAPAPPVKPAPQPLPTPAPKPKPVVKEPEVTLPSPPQPEPTVIRPQLPPKAEPPAEKPKPAPRARRTTPAKPKAETPPVEAPPKPEPAAEAAGAPEPRLGEVLPDDKRQELLRNVEGMSGEARRVLGALEQRRLTKAQAETAARIRNFLQQADTAKGTDLTAALEFARRASALARDLEAQVR